MNRNIDNLVNFYNTLFGIEIAIFGIISAVIFIFIQIVFSTYSFKHIGHILRDKLLILYFTFSILDLFLTAIGSYFLSLGSHDIIPGVYFYTDIIVSNQYYSLSCLLLIFISLTIFIKLIIKNISYLQPHRAIFLLSQNLNYIEIRNYLWKKYILKVPFILRLGGTVKAFLIDDNESEKSYKARLKKQQKKDEIELKRIELEIKTIDKKIIGAEDPILPIRDMMILFLRRSDLSSLDDACKLIENATDNFLKELPPHSESWKPENELSLNFIKHLIETFNTLLEVSSKEGLESAKQIILKSSYSIAVKFFEHKRYKETDEFGEWWQKIADNSIGKSSVLFRNIIGYYRNIGSKLFDLINKDKSRNSEENERLLDNVFRYLGWLGERLLIKVPFEEIPLFINFEYSTEYDDYYNCLMSFDDLYRRNPDLYPLIYFDALVVVMKRLVKIYKNNQNNNLDENIYSIAHSFAYFAEEAISVGNGAGASLAALRIEETYSELKDAGLGNKAKDVISLLVRIGMAAASSKENVKQAHFMSETLDEWVINTLTESNENIEYEVRECHIKSIGKDHDTRWNFITRLGKKMGSSFGLMFDYNTGELYPSDDPRRK